MGRAASRSDIRVQALLAELEVVHPEHPGALAAALPKLRELARVDAIVCASSVQTTSGWVLDRFHADGLPNQTRFRTLVTSYLVRTTGTYGWFNPEAPEDDQRNVLIDPRERIPAGDYEASRGYREVLQPLQLHRHVLTRALLCEESTLLAWLGIFHAAPLTAEQRRLFEVVLPAVRRRLATERRLEAAPVVAAALEALLGQIAAPAFVISSTGRIHETNAAGRAVLAARRAEVSAAILAALAHERPDLEVELTPLEGRGAEDHWLAVLRASARDSRVSGAVARAAARLKLRRRQREILAHLVAGETPARIAAALGISERAVEQHLTAIFDRAG